MIIDGMSHTLMMPKSLQAMVKKGVGKCNVKAVLFPLGAGRGASLYGFRMQVLFEAPAEHMTLQPFIPNLLSSNCLQCIAISLDWDVPVCP